VLKPHQAIKSPVLVAHCRRKLFGHGRCSRGHCKEEKPWHSRNDDSGRLTSKSRRWGFGAWAIGGGGWAYGWGPQDDAGSIASIRHAVRRGVNWIDTAAIYGLGHSEEVVGRALREIPASERPFVFTKCGMIPDRERPYDEPARDLRPESIRREVEASLRRLGVERIDLYQFHWPDGVGTPIEDSWGEMGRLVDEGKVRAAGVSNFDVALLERAESVRHVDSLQPPFSLVRRDAAADVIPWAAPTGRGSSCTARCSRACSRTRSR
jgi:aryl-alcohol dehydrogenase-like predicted oxidoreductase